MSSLEATALAGLPRPADLFDGNHTALPIVLYENGAKSVQGFFRAHLPFTYIAYHSILPSKDDDWVDIAYRICNYIVFRFIIDLGILFVSRSIYYIPFIPFVLDAIWIVRDYCKQQKEPLPSFFPARWHHISCLAIVFLCACGVRYLQRYLPFDYSIVKV